MRVLLHAWGSRGDVEPMLALATELRGRGHELSIAAARDFQGGIIDQGFGAEQGVVVAADLLERDWGLQSPAS